MFFRIRRLAGFILLLFTVSLVAPAEVSAATEKRAPTKSYSKSSKKVSKQSVKRKSSYSKSTSKARSGKKASRSSYKSKRNRAAQSQLMTGRYAAFVIDSTSGKVLHEESANAQRYPASLTKMMTLYLVFEALRDGRLNWDQMLPVSQRAADQPQTNIALSPGGSVSVRTLVLSLIIRSANDSAVVVAEELGGSVEGFAEKMTEKARQLGMARTTFRNASGLPDSGQVTTARDMSKLGIALYRDFPEYYPYFKTKFFSYRGRTYETHNRVIGRFDGADGIKTGFIGSSGFNLVTSAKRNGHRLVGVVFGGVTAASRDNKMISLLENSFLALERNPYENYAKAEVEEPAKQEAPEVSAEEAPPPQSEVSSVAVAESGKDWGIQLGVFPQASMVKKAIADARTVAPELLAQHEAVQNTSEAQSGIHRARLGGFSADEAEAACEKIRATGTRCFAFEQSAGI